MWRRRKSPQFAHGGLVPILLFSPVLAGHVPSPLRLSCLGPHTCLMGQEPCSWAVTWYKNATLFQL